MRRTDDVILWPWPLTLKLVRSVACVMEYSPAKLILPLFVVDLWAIGRRRVSVGGATRRYYVEMANTNGVTTWQSGRPAIVVFLLRLWKYLDVTPYAGCRWGMKKIAIFDQHLTVSEIIKDKAIVTMKRQFHNRSVECHFQWSRVTSNPDFEARHYSTLNISETVQDRDI